PRGCGRGLRRGPRSPGPDLSLRPPLPRTQDRPSALAQAGRPADPRAHPLPRSDRSPHRRRPDDMKLTELDPALRKLRLSGMADHLEMRILEAQKSHWAPSDLGEGLAQGELTRRGYGLLERRMQQA